jgi:excisionase family DNA binding protein
MAKEKKQSEWVSLRDAAAILGVHPATVRNWADRGDLASRRTPGGHRRFRREELEQWASASQNPPPAEVRMLVQSALGRMRLHISEGQMRDMPWARQMDENTRMAMRQRGIQLMEALQAFLADSPEDAAALGRVQNLGRDYATFLMGQGLSLKEIMQGFLVFSDFVHEAALNIVEMVNLRAPHEWISLLRRVRRFNNELLLSMCARYQEGIGEQRGSDDA